MSSIVEDFLAYPKEILLERCTKEEILQIAEQFDVEVTSSDKKLKETLMEVVKSALSERGVLEVRAQVINPEESVSFPFSDADQNVKFTEMALQEKQLYVDAEKLCAECDVFALKEKELENDFEIRKLQQQQQLELRKIELQFEKEREEREFQLRKLELELKAKTAEIPIPVSLDESACCTCV